MKYMRKTNSHTRKATTILFRQTDRIHFASITERFFSLTSSQCFALHILQFSCVVKKERRLRQPCKSCVTFNQYFFKWPVGGGWWGIEKLQKICYVIKEAETVKIMEIINYLRDLGCLVHVDDLKRISSLS